MKKRIFIIIVVILLVLIIVGTLAVYVINRNKKLKMTSALGAEFLLPDIVQEDFEYNLSTTEETTENVIFTITSTHKEYPIYYAIWEMDDNKNEIDIKNEDYILYEKEIILERNSYIFLKYKDNEIYSTFPFKIEIKNIISSPEDETVTEEELKEAQVDEEEKKNNESKYYIKVNYGANVVTVYKKDENNEYTIPVKAMICSTGTATPTGGVYKTTNKYVWRKLIGNVWGHYSTRIVGSILFHSVPYLSNSNDTLEYWEYDKLGTRASAGCIRLTVADAKWIYNNCASGTMVEFYSSSNPGPLGKPSSKKISQYENLRNWDPTDSSANNPWNNANIEENNGEPQQPTTDNTEPEPTPTPTPDPTPTPEPEPEPTPEPEPDLEPTPEPDPGAGDDSEGEEGNNPSTDEEQGGDEGTEGDEDPAPEQTLEPDPEPTLDSGTDNNSGEGTENVETN